MLGRFFCTEPGRRMTLLSTTAEVAALCTELAREPYVAVDTEFMRDRTYWPKLCLVQLAGAKRHAAIDPLATGIDLAPLFALMANPQVLKVFHAARQDIEVFHRLTGEVPTPLFDTQLAAMVCGYGEEVGYETLVSQIAKGRVDKSSRFTDWSRRPLSAQQLAYALGDVIHLRVIYERLRRQLEQTGRSDWVAQELADLTDPATYRQPLGEAWKRIKVRSRDPRFLAVLRALATWREAEAQRRDLPRNRVIRDDLLLEVAANRPTSVEQLAKLRRISLDRQSAAAVVEAVHAALALPEHELPRLEAPPKLPRGLGPMIDLLRVLLRLKSEEHHVAQRLVATTGDLEAIATQERPDVAALNGWRFEVFGRSALALKRGELGLAIADGQIVLIPIAGLLEFGISPGHDGRRSRLRPTARGRSGQLHRPAFSRGLPGAGQRRRASRDRSPRSARGGRSRDQLRAPLAARQRALPGGDDGPRCAARGARRRPRDRLRDAELAQGLCAERKVARRDRQGGAAGPVWTPQACGRAGPARAAWPPPHHPASGEHIRLRARAGAAHVPVAAARPAGA